jgi:hypothetical protein
LLSYNCRNWYKQKFCLTITAIIWIAININIVYGALGILINVYIGFFKPFVCRFDGKEGMNMVRGEGEGNIKGMLQCSYMEKRAVLRCVLCA